MTYIRAKVHPDSKKDEIQKISEDKFEVWVRDKAQNNAANKKLCQLMVQYFDNPEGGVQILNGHHSRIKLLKIGNE